jgi:DNA-binding response OmpR family regulator
MRGPDEVGGGAVATAETVLVVEDDVLIRSVIAAYLRDCGYRVVEAADGEEAKTVLSREDGRIDILLTDVEMPGGMDGFALAQWVRERRPEVEVVMAGSPRRAAEAAGDLCEQGPHGAKPYEPQVVLDRIRRLLAGRRRR